MRNSPRLLTTLALLGLAAIACALYLPYLGNPPVFDDRIFFSGYRFSEYASAPLGKALRFPPYFSLAFVQVVFGSMEAHRVVSLILHIGCAWALYALIRAVQLSRLAAFAAAALFAVHPAAVYGAGYLTQRSIVLATLFSLLSLLLFVRGLRTGRYSDALAAAVLGALAVLSKEHAILLPGVAIALAVLAAPRLAFAARYAAVYVLAIAPAAVLAVLFSRGAIGEVIEPHFETVASQVSGGAALWSGPLSSPWLGSAVAQAGLFFKYLLVWLLPSTGNMSLDLRVDFGQYWAPAVALPAIFCFVASAVLATALVLRRGPLALPAFGFLYFWILFLVELAAVRFQEPFVLYRSYLWAPGLALLVAWAIERMPPRIAVAALVPALLVLGWEARDRLQTFSSGLELWEDVVAKLPAQPVAGGHRALYEVGREYLYAGRLQDALQVVERCNRDYPKTFDCFFARAAIQIELKQYKEALPSIAEAIALRPREGAARHHLGLILENVGCTDEALAQYRIAIKLGFRSAAQRIRRIETPGQGVLAPGETPVAPLPPAECAALVARTPLARPG